MQINVSSPASDTVTSPPKKRASGKAERTRASLVQAAARLIGAVGYEGLTMEAVAEAAGVTRRTVYGHFETKTALIMAAVVDRWAVPSLQPAAGATLQEHLRALGPVVVESAKTRRPRAVHAAAFEVYALTHEDMRRRTLEQFREIYDRVEAGMAASFPAESFPMTPALMVRLLDALIDGLTRRRVLAPEIFGDEVILAAFEALAKLAAKPSE